MRHATDSGTWPGTSSARRVPAASSSERTRSGAQGSEKRIVPSATELAPALRNSSHVASRDDPSHADDRELDRSGACVHAGKGDRSQGRAGVAARPAGEHGLPSSWYRIRAPGSCSRARGRRLLRLPRHARTPRRPRWPAKASRRAAFPLHRGPPRRARPPSPVLLRRSGTRDSARSSSRARTRRGGCRGARNRPPRSRRRTPRSARRAWPAGAGCRARTHRYRGSASRSSSTSRSPSRRCAAVDSPRAGAASPSSSRTRRGARRRPEPSARPDSQRR